MNTTDLRPVIRAAERVVEAAGPAALKAAREREGKSVAAWAADLSVTRQAVYLWERGDRHPRGLAAVAYTDAMADRRSK